MVSLGWKSVGVLELTALPRISTKSSGCRWSGRRMPCWSRAATSSTCATGCASPGFADLLPSLNDTVWVGLSAGSMVMTLRIGEDFIQWRPPTGDETTWGSSTSRSVRASLPMACRATRWPRRSNGRRASPNTAYAMDDETAIKVVDGTVEFVSEGHWKRFPS